MAPDGRMVDLLLESALVVRVALGATPETELFAEIVSPLAADATLSTSYTDFESDAVANFEARDLRPDTYDLACRFVPER